MLSFSRDDDSGHLGRGRIQSSPVTGCLEDVRCRGTFSIHSFMFWRALTFTLPLSFSNPRKEQSYTQKCWQDVQVGDFIQMQCNETIPADTLLLFSSDPSGICHLETSNLDGEANLKQRRVVKGFTQQVGLFLRSSTGMAKGRCRPVLLGNFI